ncbi:rhomboid family intramembrane serine protease [Streptomyces sp. NPDC001056]
MDHVASSTPDARSVPVCYRHPDRESGVRCTRCERPICPECMVSASVGFQCPECVHGGGPAHPDTPAGAGAGRSMAAARPRTLAGGTMTADPRLFTKVLIGVNIALFLMQQAVGDSFTVRFAMIGQYPGVQGVADGQFYRLLTAMFLHGGITHLLFNMLSLWWIGGPLEAALGRARYLSLYFVSGLAGSALTYAVAPHTLSLGASGAIFGLFGATGVLMRRLNYNMRPLFALLVINLIITFTPGFNIAWEAHVGGLVAGVVTGYAMVHAPRRNRALVQYGTCALVLVAVAVLTLVRTTQLT